MWQSLTHIQNLWLTMAVLETYDGDDARPGKHRRHPTTRAIQSRAFIITDLMGQLRLDGFVDVEKFISHSIGFSGGQLPPYAEGSSALDFPLIYDALSQDQP